MTGNRAAAARRAPHAASGVSVSRSGGLGQLVDVPLAVLEPCGFVAAEVDQAIDRLHLPEVVVLEYDPAPAEVGHDSLDVFDLPTGDCVLGSARGRRAEEV